MPFLNFFYDIYSPSLICSLENDSLGLMFNLLNLKYLIAHLGTSQGQTGPEQVTLYKIICSFVMQILSNTASKDNLECAKIISRYKGQPTFPVMVTKVVMIQGTCACVRVLVCT